MGRFRPRDYASELREEEEGEWVTHTKRQFKNFRTHSGIHISPQPLTPATASYEDMLFTQLLKTVCNFKLSKLLNN